jgi:hypothetical protein
MESTEVIPHTPGETAQGIPELAQAERLLEHVQTLPEARDLIASVEAMKLFMKRVALGFSALNRAAAIVIKARRKVGEMTKLIERDQGGRPLRNSGHESPSFSSLQDAAQQLGVDRRTIKRWEQLADQTTEEEIDRLAAEFTAVERELTAKACLPRKHDQASSDQRREVQEPRVDPWERLLGRMDREPLGVVLQLLNGASEMTADNPFPVECARAIPADLRSAIRISDTRLLVMWLKLFCDECDKLNRASG